MKSSEEMMNSLLERRDRYVTEQTARRRKLLRAGVPVLSLCLVLIAGFMVWKGRETPQTSGGPKDGDGYEFSQPPKSDQIVFSKEKITDAEAKAYFEENYAGIVSALKASGVKAEGLEIAEKGISRLVCEGGTLEYRENFRDYPAYADGKLAAVLTLTKENGRYGMTPSFGGESFAMLDAFLKKHAGEKLIPMYYNSLEVWLLPDGTAESPFGFDVSDQFKWVKNPYEWFYNEDVVFVP